MGVGHVGLCVCVGGGAHTGLIGEQAALGTLTDSGLDSVAEAAADNGLRLESILEDHGESSGDVGDAGHQDGQTAQQEDSGHDGNDLLSNGGQTLHTAQEDNRADDDKDHAGHPGGDAESGIHGGADGVGLHHAAHEAQRQHDSHGEEARQELTEAALERGGDVVHGATADGAVGIDDTGLLGQRGFGVDGSHAEEGDDPHPEDGAGAAGQDSAGSAHDVAGTHLSGDGGGQRLEGAHTGVVLVALQLQVAEHLAHTLAEAAHLHEAGLDGVPQTYADQQKHQNVVAQVFVDLTYDGKQYGFDGLHVDSLLFNRKIRAAAMQRLRRNKVDTQMSSLSFCLRDSARSRLTPSAPNSMGFSRVPSPFSFPLEF